VVSIVALASSESAGHRYGECIGNPLNSAPMVTTNAKGQFSSQIDVGAPPFAACLSLTAFPPVGVALRSSMISVQSVQFRTLSGPRDTVHVVLKLEP